MTKITWIWKERDQIDLGKMQDAVENNRRSIYAFPFYLDAVAKNWGSYIKGDYEDVYPLSWTNYLGVRQAYLPNFQGVNFFTKNGSDTDEFVSLLQKDWKYYDLHLIQEEGHPDGRDYQILKLKEEISYSTNAKRLIKKAHKEDLVFENSNDWAEVFQIFKSFTFEKIDGLQMSDMPYFEKLLRSLAGNGKLHCIQIKNKDKVVGGGFFIPSGNRIIYLKGAAEPEVMKSGGMYAMMDFAIQQYKNQFKIFDFGGSAVTNVAEFNRKMGGQNRKTVSLQSRSLPKWYQWTQKLYRTIKK